MFGLLSAQSECSSLKHQNGSSKFHLLLAKQSTEAFIARLAMVLVCAGLAASGYAIVMPPCPG